MLFGHLFLPTTGYGYFKFNCEHCFPQKKVFSNDMSQHFLNTAVALIFPLSSAGMQEILLGLKSTRIVWMHGI